MLNRHLMGGLAAALIAVATLASASTGASAASVKYSYGSWTNHSTIHNGRRAIQVCRIKYKLTYYRGAWHKVPDGKDCHWTFPVVKPIHPIKPIHPLKPIKPIKKY